MLHQNAAPSSRSPRSRLRLRCHMFAQDDLRHRDELLLDIDTLVEYYGFDVPVWKVRVRAYDARVCTPAAPEESGVLPR
jgi:hypothetical protein